MNNINEKFNFTDGINKNYRETIANVREGLRSKFMVKLWISLWTSFGDPIRFHIEQIAEKYEKQ